MARRARLARGGDRGSSIAVAKKVLLSLIVVGLLSTVTYHRVSATLSGEGSNLGSSVASGTLIGGNTVYTFSGTNTYTAGTQCKSWSAATKNNYNALCDTLVINPSTGLRFPGQTLLSYVAIKNEGTLPASEVQLSIPALTGCKTTNTLGTPAYVPAGTGGNGDYCAGGLEMYVQEVDSFTSGSTPTNKQCVFPSDVYAAPVTDCSTGWIQDTVAGLTGISCWDLGSLAASTTRYFVVAFRIDPVAPNNLQGMAASVTLRWHLDGGNLTYDTSGHPAGSSCANAPAGIGQ